jgi:acyl carrier protein phosphodiesterase
MNFLAHMRLSCGNDTLVTGNFLGDLLRNSEIRNLPANIQEGVKLHRKIDIYTDTHPVVRRSTRLLHARHGKYASVLVDIYYDFFLSRHWELFHPEPLVVFTREVYEQLLSHQQVMPERVRQYLRAMINDDWLMNYSTYEGMAFTFGKTARRVSNSQLFSGAVDSLKKYEAQLDADFLSFFPDILTYVEGECGMRE